MYSPPPHTPPSPGQSGHTPQSLRDSSPNLGEQLVTHLSGPAGAVEGPAPAINVPAPAIQEPAPAHSSPKLGEVARRAGGVCKPIDPQSIPIQASQSLAQSGHTPQSLRDSSPNLGEQLVTHLSGPAGAINEPAPAHSSPKLGEVAQRAGGVCPNPTPNKRTHNTSNLKTYRRELRTYGTPAEGRLWSYLKRRQVDGLHFRRQFSVGDSILDFFCPELQLAIELDGDYHRYISDHDYSRDQEMQRHGITTLRFENRIVFEQPETIIESIRQVKQAVRGEEAGKFGQSGHTPQSLRDSSPNLGEQLVTHLSGPAGAIDGIDSPAGAVEKPAPAHSSPKLGEVAQRAGGVCSNFNQMHTYNPRKYPLKP